MIAVDTSVVVAAFASWHQHHRRALTVLDRQPGLPLQAAIEAYSVLTRLPPPHRAPAAVVHDFLERNFGGAILALSADRILAAVAELARNGIVGGASYDGLIAFIAHEGGRTLVSFDSRARQTYDRLGVAVEFAA